MNQNEHLGFLKVTHTHIQKEKRPLPNAEKVSFYFQNLVTSINELVAMAAPWSKVQIYPSDSFEAMSTKLNGINQKKNYSFIKVSCFLFGWLVVCFAGVSYSVNCQSQAFQPYILTMLGDTKTKVLFLYKPQLSSTVYLILLDQFLKL